jgi:hypothetical protein
MAGRHAINTRFAAGFSGEVGYRHDSTESSAKRRRHRPYVSAGENLATVIRGVGGAISLMGTP